MSDLDTNKSFNHMWYIWRFAGMYPYKKLKWLYYTYGFIVNFIAGVLTPGILVLTVFFLEDIASILKTLQGSLYLATLTIKQFMVFRRLPELQKAKHFISQLDQRACANKDEYKLLKRTIRQCEFIALFIEISFLLSSMGYCLSVFSNGRLIFEGWYSADLISAYYLPIYASQFLPIAFIVIQNCANDAYPPASIILLNGHIRALCMRVARIGNDPSKTLEENYKELKSCVDDHKNIISLLDIFRPTISQTVLLQLIITGAVLCLTVFNFLTFSRHGLGKLLSTIFDMLSILSVSFPICYFGNSLMDHTSSLTTAIYDCNWIDQNAKFRKSMIIFMQRSQRDNIIQAGGLITINLQTFIAIIRLSFSLFTLLSQLSEGFIVSH